MYNIHEINKNFVNYLFIFDTVYTLEVKVLYHCYYLNPFIEDMTEAIQYSLDWCQITPFSNLSSEKLWFITKELPSTYAIEGLKEKFYKAVNENKFKVSYFEMEIQIDNLRLIEVHHTVEVLSEIPI